VSQVLAGWRLLRERRLHRLRPGARVVFSTKANLLPPVRVPDRVRRAAPRPVRGSTAILEGCSREPEARRW
jgi:hypothetical protein